LQAAYQSAIERGLWKNTYASTNPSEYWAESAQDWFDNNRHEDSLHNQVHTQAMLKEYDPVAAKLTSSSALTTSPNSISAAGATPMARGSPRSAGSPKAWMSSGKSKQPRLKGSSSPRLF
jgi:hypothetical protein